METFLVKLKEVKSFMNKDVSFQIEEIFPNLIHLKFKSKKDLTSTFLRIQEYYESPKFRNTIFSLKEFHIWYSNQKGKFSYLTDWAGFNVPCKAFKPFLNNEFKNLTRRELILLESIKNRKGKFYVIGTYRGSNSKNNAIALKHEIAHALFHMNPKYKREVLKVLKTIDLKLMIQDIEDQGYHKSVLKDEANAYIVADYDYFKQFHKNRKDIYLKLNKLYKQAFKEMK